MVEVIRAHSADEFLLLKYLIVGTVRVSYSRYSLPSRPSFGETWHLQLLLCLDLYSIVSLIKLYDNKYSRK